MPARLMKGYSLLSESDTQEDKVDLGTNVSVDDILSCLEMVGVRALE